MPKLRVKVIPKSRHPKLAFEANQLKAWLRSPPIEGRANDELIEILAKKIGISKSSIKILSGFTGKNKVVDILGVSENELKKLLS